MLIVTGLPRTGTTSLAAALEILGFSVLHYCPLTNYKTKATFEREQYKLLINKHSLSYDAIVSNALLLYPVSVFLQDKVIITIRPNRYEWERSIEQFGIHPSIYDELRMNQYVINENHKDILLFDIFSGDKWEKLCSYLNMDIPNVEFPNINKSKISYEI